MATPTTSSVPPPGHAADQENEVIQSEGVSTWTSATALSLVVNYYRSHQPKFNDPRITNVDIAPPIAPCFCPSCELVRQMPQVLSPSWEKQVLWIMQGAPGSGKSLAKQISSQQPPGTVVICSTDTYSIHPRTGQYIWSFDRLAENHASNLKRAQGFLDEGRSVIVDNTNIFGWQCREYVKHAMILGVQVEFVRATGNYGNSHGVPLAKVEEMRRKMEVLTVESVLDALAPGEFGGRRTSRRALVQQQRQQQKQPPLSFSFQQAIQQQPSILAGQKRYHQRVTVQEEEGEEEVVVKEGRRVIEATSASVMARQSEVVIEEEKRRSKAEQKEQTTLSTSPLKNALGNLDLLS